MILYAALTASDWITLFSALATLLISIVSGVFVIKFNIWSKKKEEAAEIAKNEDKLSELNRQFQTDIFSINSDITKESIHVLDESFRTNIAKNKAKQKFSKNTKDDIEELHERVYRSRLELASLIERHIYKFKNILREKEMLITQYYKHKIINDEYVNSYPDTNSEIIYKCNLCQQIIDIDGEWKKYLKLSNVFTKEVKDLANIEVDFTKQLEQFVDDSNKLEQLIGYGIILSKDFKFYLKDEFIMFHTDCF
ncbi:hypothetical protein [Spiroplasma endosymbiont of Othius punctulatus]|uniref:hypothetical protein n=1 Tax=Spiroplasma endosymbiont of Othius punctulatus TaxID=3066289 RepID=UPI0030CF6042